MSRQLYGKRAMLADLTDITREEIVAALPASLADMARIIPMEAILSLIQERGGIRVYVKCLNSENGELARVIGEQNAKLLSNHYGREIIAIPRALSVHRMIRNHRISNARKAGKTITQLARLFNLTERSIYSILQKASG